MKDLKTEKDNLRKKIALLKKEYTADDLLDKSDEVLSVIEITGVFQEARKIFIYCGMDGEIATLDFIEKWKNEKEFYLPVTLEDRLVFKKYTSTEELIKSAFGILEPIGDEFANYNEVDLIIVPGVAFSKTKERMGYGRAYYDKFLPKLKAPRMGVCFDFQLSNTIPVGDSDIKMDYIISENDLIW